MPDFDYKGFMQDFMIADRFGEAAVRDTYKRAFREWKDNVIADWCTDTIYYAYWKSENFLYVQECVSEKSAYYKVRVFYGQYQ